MVTIPTAIRVSAAVSIIKRTIMSLPWKKRYMSAKYHRLPAIAKAQVGTEENFWIYFVIWADMAENRLDYHDFLRKFSLF